MDSKTFTAVLHLHKQRKKVDVEIPFDITANDLILALNEAYKLGMDTGDLSQCYLKTENPIALLKGNKKLKDYGLYNGTVINHTL